MILELKLRKIIISNYRSISRISINVPLDKPLIICGPNNIGKTNILRALDLFFSLDKERFDKDLDVPYHIAEGSAGGGNKSVITVEFIDIEAGDAYSLTTEYMRKNNENTLNLTGKKNNNIVLDAGEVKKIISDFRYTFVQSNNIDLPLIISQIFNNEVLPSLDKLRSRQTEPLKLLQQFFSKSQDAVRNIEKGITNYLKEFVDDVEGIKSKDWSVKVIFPEFDYLREAISGQVTYTLFDSNERQLDTKGSGIQRLMLLSLIRYISDNSKDRVIWGIDEPEVFLQPGLQKKVFKELKSLSKQMPVIITTHSPYFIDINDLESTFILDADYEIKAYARRPRRHFIRVDTKVSNVTGINKVEAIKKHMGIGRNDGWQITPYNVLVEGTEDKDYLLALSSIFDFECPNILVAGGADKIPGYLEFLKEFCHDIDFKPRILCILDHDEAGKNRYKSLNEKKYKEFDLIIEFVSRCDGLKEKKWNYEMEDLIYTDIVLEATNRILKRRNYRIITKRDINKRWQPAYVGTGILKFITDIISNNNADKEPLNFETQGLKIYLSKEICALLGQVSSVDELNTKYPEVKQFIEKVYQL